MKVRSGTVNCLRRSMCCARIYLALGAEMGRLWISFRRKSAESEVAVPPEPELAVRSLKKALARS